MTRQAVILNGGKGTRMRPYTDNRPKGLVEVGGKSILAWQVGWLTRYGVTDIVIAAGYHGELLDTAAAELVSRIPGVKINVVREATPLGRGGGMKFAAKHLPYDEAWFGVNGDIITDLNLTDLEGKRAAADVIGMLALVPYQSAWGVVDVDESTSVIRGFRQSPQLPYWVNGGIYCFTSAFIEKLPDSGDHEDSLFPQLAKAGRLGAYLVDTYWKGVDTVKDVLAAEEDIVQRRVVLPEPAAVDS